MPPTSTSHEKQVNVATPMTPPEWALLERELLRGEAEACEEFFDKYFDQRGYLLCVPRWGGDDGPDDAGENLLNWTMLHALGGSDRVLKLFGKAWEGHLRQYTEAETVQVELGRGGMYYREFPTMFDWFHIGEWISPYVLLGLSNPFDHDLVRRARTYAGFYMNQDSQAQNYDPRYKIIRSMFNGSRGPLLRKATGLDWAGDPIEISGRFKPGHGERTFDEILAHFKDYNDIVGDHPLNLGATTLAVLAYTLTGERAYRDWCLEYIGAWVERTKSNRGLIPTNVGRNGEIGGECDGRWFGGVYGWGFSVVVPQTGAIAHRPFFYMRCHYGFGNGLLLTGDQMFVDTWRGVIEQVNENQKVVDGRRSYPRCFGDQGWYDFRPEPFDAGALEVWYWSMRPEDASRLPSSGWTGFLQGQAPEYPITALRQDLAELRSRVELMRHDDSTPDTRMSDDPNELNPAITETLTQLMLGGLPTGRVGSPLHCRLRYFDPALRRAGIPADVGALVTSMTADDVCVTLVNLSPVWDRIVTVQAGAYGEHQITEVAHKGETTRVDARHFAVKLAAGCGASLIIRMRRYANQPTLGLPWS